MNRRTYLTLATAAVGTAAISGFSSAQTDGTLRYGYGGDPYLLPRDPTTVDESETTDANANDACFDAEPIARNATVSGSLETAGVDWYAIDLAGGEAVDVTFERGPATGVTGVVVYGPECTYVTMRQVGHGQSVTLGVTAETAGTHYVELVDVESGDGDYTVVVEPVDAIAEPTPVDADVYGTQAYGEQGYGGVPS